jgi:hypothetical protein
MLTNLGLTGYLQSMLGFAPGYDQTVEQPAVFLEAADEKVSFSVERASGD